MTSVFLSARTNQSEKLRETVQFCAYTYESHVIGEKSSTLALLITSERSLERIGKVKSSKWNLCTHLYIDYFFSALSDSLSVTTLTSHDIS